MSQQPVIDLFAGVGGLSLGAARAGFTVKAAVDRDAIALDTHAKNFPNSRHLNRDIRCLKGSRLLDLAGLRRGQLAGLIGGPPCQGFSTMGLRAEKDPRNRLFLHFFRLVSETLPAFFLAENVPGLLHERNDGLRTKAFAMLPKKYEVVGPVTVKANEYGAPTSRKRVFYFGYDADRVGELEVKSFAPGDWDDVRVGMALRNLPGIRAGWQTEAASWRAVGELGDSWFDVRLKDLIPAGVGDPDSIKLHSTKRMVSGFLGTEHSKKTVRRFDALLPGESDVVSKCVRLDRDGYCPTLRAGTGSDRGSYQAIRPVHPSSPRVIAPREAARLQGFPDWFQFHPTKWHAFRQIGNSVSPIVGERLLRKVREALD